MCCNAVITIQIQIRIQRSNITPISSYTTRTINTNTTNRYK